MTLEQFCATNRVPTPAELVAFAADLGFRVEARGGRGVLHAPKDNRLARTLAKFLSREPYRTGVMAEVGGADAPPSPPADSAAQARELTDDEVEAIAERAFLDPPDFGESGVAERESVLVCLPGFGVAAISPDQAKEWGLTP